MITILVQAPLLMAYSNDKSCVFKYRIGIILKKKLLLYLIMFAVFVIFMYGVGRIATDIQIRKEKKACSLHKLQASVEVIFLKNIIHMISDESGELPPDTVSELVMWLYKDNFDNFSTETIRIDTQNKMITGRFGETIDFYKNKNGNYILISYGKNNIFENGSGDDYLLEFDESFDELTRQDVVVNQP